MLGKSPATDLLHDRKLMCGYKVIKILGIMWSEQIYFLEKEG
jgi:hypothetical protein